MCFFFFVRDWNERDMVPEWLETWRALEDLQKRKVVRYIGVSNFELEELEKLVKLALVQPFAIQNWMDPLHQDRQARNFCRERGIEYMAYSLLGTQHQFRAGTYSQENPVLENPIIRRIASNHNLESTIPVILTWALSNQVVIIPRSRNSEHIASNWNLPQEIHLSKEEIEEINNL
jgi:diketogulonate reductase-like aldo/keto reductase